MPVQHEPAQVTIRPGEINLASSHPFTFHPIDQAMPAVLALPCQASRLLQLQIGEMQRSVRLTCSTAVESNGERGINARKWHRADIFAVISGVIPNLCSGNHLPTHLRDSHCAHTRNMWQEVLCRQPSKHS